MVPLGEATLTGFSSPLASSAPPPVRQRAELGREGEEESGAGAPLPARADPAFLNPGRLPCTAGVCVPLRLPSPRNCCGMPSPHTGPAWSILGVLPPPPQPPGSHTGSHNHARDRFSLPKCQRERPAVAPKSWGSPASVPHPPPGPPRPQRWGRLRKPSSCSHGHTGASVTYPQTSGSRAACNGL